MDSEARAHIVDGQKQPNGLFLGRGLVLCSHKERSESSTSQEVLFVLVRDIERGLCSLRSLKVFFDARRASFCFAKTENFSEARAYRVATQKRHSVSFLDRGLTLCSHLERSGNISIS